MQAASRMPAESSTIKVLNAAAVHSSRIKTVSICDGSTMGDERLVVYQAPAKKDCYTMIQ
jgi:hypothetical protein